MQKLVEGLVVSALALALASAVQAQDETSTELPADIAAAIAGERIYEPDGDWRVRRPGGRCSVIRDFRLGDDEVTLQVQRLQPGLPTQFVVVGGGLSASEVITAGFAPGSGMASFDRVGAARRGDTEAVFFAGRLFPWQGAQGPGETILSMQTSFFVAQSGEGEPLVLRTGAIDGALASLADCGEQQLAEFGVGIGQRGSYESLPELQNWSHLDTPLGRLWNSNAFLRGTMTLRLIVDADGRVSDCRPSDDRHPANLTREACETISARARYTPALDRSGQPVADYVIQRIMFDNSDLLEFPNSNGTNPLGNN